MKNPIEISIAAEEPVRISNKVRYAGIREAIKKLADQQAPLKNHRKTVRRVGSEIMSPWKAMELREMNRYHLRHLHRAYNILKDIEPSKVTKADISATLVNNNVKKYSIQGTPA